MIINICYIAVKNRYPRRYTRCKRRYKPSAHPLDLLYLIVWHGVGLILTLAEKAIRTATHKTDANKPVRTNRNKTGQLCPRCNQFVH